jgi:hypothetical protein
MAVILDLHWTSAPGKLGNGQWPMADSQSVTFWTSVADTYRDDPSVMFDLFNEPFSRDGAELSWGCWRDGGCQLPNVSQDDPPSGPTYTVSGMAALVAAVRGAGARQPILLAGLEWANDMTGWLAHKPQDSQLVVSWHDYQGQTCSNLDCWKTQVAPVAAQVPVLITELGYENDDPGYFERAMQWADSAGIGYLPWAWWKDTGTAYELYADDYQPNTPEGAAYHNHLERIGSKPR